MNILMLSSLLAVSASAQKISTQYEVVDCGQVVFRKPVTAEFLMKNEGSKPLIIHQVYKSCGCTEVVYLFHYHFVWQYMYYVRREEICICFLLMERAKYVCN